jgi:hypothetical protein
MFYKYVKFLPFYLPYIHIISITNNILKPKKKTRSKHTKPKYWRNKLLYNN